MIGFGKEKELRKRGYRRIAGLDEVGRGPLAGPVYSVAVVVNDYQGIKDKGKAVNDSKKLSALKREEIFLLFKDDKRIDWGVGIVSSKVIDKIGIVKSVKLSMKKALKKVNPDYLLIDGNFKILGINEESVIKGDEKIFSCALASIIAKTLRDRKMLKYHRRYPHYGFDKNKGYGTLFHRKQIEKYGYSEIHRKSFKIKKLVL